MSEACPDGDTSCLAKLEEKNIRCQCLIHFLSLFCPPPHHSLGLGFSVTLLVIGFFLFLIAPTSSDLHHQVRLSQREICEQMHSKQKLYI